MSDPVRKEDVEQLLGHFLETLQEYMNGRSPERITGKKMAYTACLMILAETVDTWYERVRIAGEITHQLGMEIGNANGDINITDRGNNPLYPFTDENAEFGQKTKGENDLQEVL